MNRRNHAFKSISLNGFLSFPYDSEPVVLAPLNVLVGPNSSGKSNFLEAFAVLKAAPKDLAAPFQKGGGVSDWIFASHHSSDNGNPESHAVATLKVTVSTGQVGARQNLLCYAVDIAPHVGGGPAVLNEELTNADFHKGDGEPKAYVLREGDSMVLSLGELGGNRRVPLNSLLITQSILSQRKDPDSYKRLSELAALFESIHLFQKWVFGPDSPARDTSAADARGQVLEETTRNLAARLATLTSKPEIKRRLLKELRALAPGLDDLAVTPIDGRLRLSLTEGDRSTPAHRLSDGTLRYLALLAILLDPAPPPVVLIEEPELGLHPDALPALHALLVEASTRCQIVMTTHSPALLDAFTDDAHCVLVCEKGSQGTTLRRLTKKEGTLAQSLGGLGNWWLSGGIGGVRW